MFEPCAGAPLPPWRHRVTLGESVRWSEVLLDPNPIHSDPLAVARLGLGDRPISPGPASIAYLINMLSSAFEHGEVRSLSARMIGFVFVGDEVEVNGEVTTIERTSGGVRVNCSLVLHAGADRELAVRAVAVVGLPDAQAPRPATGPRTVPNA